LVSQEYPPQTGGGGIGTQTALKALGLSARGHLVHVIASSWDREARVQQDGGAVIHRIPEPDLPVPGFEPSSYFLAYSHSVARKLTELSREVPFDLFHFPEYAGEGFFFQSDTFAHRTGRYVVQMHGPLGMFVDFMGWPDRGSPMERIGCFMERMVLNLADGWMASSRSSAEYCSLNYGVPLDRVEVVHSGLDAARFAPRPRPDGEGFPRVLFIGNMSGAKGVTALVRAADELAERLPHLRLRMIGKGSREYAEELRRRIDATAARGRVEVLGYVPYEELPAQYAWCDVFAGPSLYEGGPGNVYLEAMACGRPVIAGRRGGVPEVVLEGRTGLLVDPGDAPGLAGAIASLAEDGALRERLGRQAREWILERFTIDKYTDRVEAFYARMLEAR